MIQVSIFWMPKDGHSTSEYEDAYATSDPDQVPFRAAVADGATESAFSGPWARRLTGTYTQTGDLGAALDDLREGFHRISRRGHVPWYLEEKSQEGSHAAFAGLEINEEGWSAQAVGDCCVLHLRHRELIGSWPLENVDQFSHTPDLISSRGGEQTIPDVRGGWREGDRFVLASDALAAFLLEQGPEAAYAEPYHDLVESARQEGTIRNDDVTAIIIDL